MKSIKNLLLIAVICLSVFSCKKDDDEKNPADYPFSKEGVEENKAKLEDAGQQMITEMKTMETVKANAVLESFVNCSSQDDPFGSMSSKNVPVLRTLNAASTLSAKENALKYLTQMMQEDVSEETPTLQAIFNEVKGVYTWNATTKAWARTASSSDFKFLFPAKLAGTTNDASLVITYSGKNVTSSMLEFGDLPVSLNLTMSSGNEKVFEMDLQASYDNNGLPTEVNYFIALYPYKYEMTWKYSSSSVSLRYHLTNDSKNILDVYGKMNGTFSMEDISNSATSEDSEEADLISDGEVYFQVFNVKIAGTMDFKNYLAAEDAIDSNLEGDAYAAKLAEAVNKYAELNLVFTDSEEKIAHVLAAPANDGSEEIKLKLAFSSEDTSPVDLETYIQTGFEGFLTDLYNFADELEDNYSK